MGNFKKKFEKWYASNGASALVHKNIILKLKGALYRIWRGVNRLSDSGVNRLGDTSAFVIPAGREKKFPEEFRPSHYLVW